MIEEEPCHYHRQTDDCECVEAVMHPALRFGAPINTQEHFLYFPMFADAHKFSGGTLISLGQVQVRLAS